MKCTLIIVVTAVLAGIITDRNAEAEQPEGYPVLAYASPSDQPPVSLYARAPRTPYLTEEGLFSGPASSASIRTDEGFIAQWRDRVFQSLSSDLAPEAGGAERVVARIAVRESMKLLLERYPGVGHLIKAMKLEVSTDGAAAEDEEAERGEAPSPGAPAQQRAAKEQFVARTGLRIPLENGRPALLSETAAVYGSIIAFLNVKLNGKLDSSLGFRYRIDRDVHVQVERTTVDVADPAAGGLVRRSAVSIVSVVCLF